MSNDRSSDAPHVVTLSRLDEFSRAIGGSRDAGASVGEFVVDGIAPAVVATPSSEGDLAAVLAEASACGLAVLPAGTGAHASIGNIPAAYDVAVSTRLLDKVVAYEPADLTITVEAGARLDDLGELLQHQNQFLPLDPPGSSGTAGGLVAANLFGPMRHAFGTVRDWLIGIRVAHADGRLSKAGGRVVKNVTGYEMTKLYTGSLGTLGVITELTFKLAPLPATDRTYVAAFDSSHAAATVLLAARDGGLALHAAELLSPPAAFALVGDARWSLVLRLAGAEAGVSRSLDEVERYAATLRATVEEADGDVWRRWRDLYALDERLSLRIGVPTSSVPETVEVLDRTFAGSAATLSATVTAGVIRAKLRPTQEHRAPALLDRARQVASARGGYVVVDAAPLSYKREHDVFGPLRPDFAIMKRIKDEFDPKRILAPGRFLGKL